jgi:phospholipid-binding lipoprotein MlaA
MTFFIRLLTLFVLLVFIQGCASSQQAGNSDPYENFNRKIFSFNDGLDRNVLAPVSRGYDAVMPGFAERGVSNFFANLYDFNGAINAVLQGRLLGAGQDSGRFLINSTVGMLGFIDVASEMGIPPYRTDFGHTLAIWGADAGPYLMIPFFGPRTVRSGTGYLVDTVASVQWGIDSFGTRAFLFGLEVIDTRAALGSAEELISGDRYIFVRDVYLQQREVFVNDGIVQDVFSDFDDEFDWDE